MGVAASDSRSGRTWAVVLPSVAFFLVNISLLVVVTALPAIRHDLRADFSTLGWVLNAYGLAFGAGVITAAALGDRLGRVKVFTVGLVVFTVASAMGGLSQDATVLIASRTLQGVGAAMIMPLSLTILSAASLPKRGESSSACGVASRGLASRSAPSSVERSRRGWTGTGLFGSSSQSV